MPEDGHIIRLYTAALSHPRLDNCALSGVNRITFLLLCTLGALGAREARQQALKGGRPPRRGHAQSDPREGPRSEVSGSEFFDPRDAVQVKYEMLRRVSVDNASVTDAADEYGVSRPTYYQAKANFDDAGIAGLVPKKPGPRGPHKIHGEVLAFLQARLAPGEPIRARELAKLIRSEFDLEVHPRTIERALKKTAG